MKQYYLPVLFLAIATCLNSCSVIGGIFKAGAVMGVLAVIVIIAVVIWIISLIRGKNQ